MIQKYLINTYPKLEELFNAVETIPSLAPSSIPLEQAVVKIVIGQMLSRKAADTIYLRLSGLTKNSNLYELSPEALLQAGVSNRKAKTITGFLKEYQKEKNRFNNWKNLEFNELSKEVNSIWGLSDWTASMLAIFHFANEDVFPYKDGTIKRALEKLEQEGIVLNIDLARPYSSYLALYLWRFIDSKVI